MTSYYEEIRDFITLHYVASQRTDNPFWRDASDVARMTPSLRQCVDDWRACAYPPMLTRQNRLFPFFSWACILLGSGILPPGPIPLFAGLDSAKVKDMIDRSRFLSVRPALMQ